MKVIETFYQGYKFRSRLEARWARYFDLMGFDYLYEHEGFDLDGAGWYLPDFYLPHVNMWAEVKPTAFNKKELQKLQALVMFTQKPALMLVGIPSRKAYDILYYDKYCIPNGLCRDNIALSNYHGYYRDEGRFYGGLYEGEIDTWQFDDIDAAVTAARSARFQSSQRGRYDDYNRTFPNAA